MMRDYVHSYVVVFIFLELSVNIRLSNYNSLDRFPVLFAVCVLISIQN